MAAPEPDEPLQQCPHCERKFNEASFEKHVVRFACGWFPRRPGRSYAVSCMIFHADDL